MLELGSLIFKKNIGLLSCELNKPGFGEEATMNIAQAGRCQEEATSSRRGVLGENPKLQKFL